MEYTFENGFMCGLLLSIDDNKNSSAKNQIFKAVVENGIPIATFKITERYKLVCMIYHNNTYRIPYTMPQLIRRITNDTVIKPTPNPSDYTGCAFPDSHIDTYVRPNEGVYIFNVIYDNDKPLWATSQNRLILTRNVSGRDVYTDKRGNGFIYKYPDDYEVNVKYGLVKEFVYWYREDYKFLLYNIE